MFKKHISSLPKLNHHGQNSVEFMLMLGTIVTIIITVFSLFNRDIVGLFFFFIGAIIS